MKRTIITSQRVGERIERMFGGENYTSGETIKRIRKAEVCTSSYVGRFIEKLTNRPITYSLNSATSIAKPWTLARTLSGRSHFFRHNSANSNLNMRENI